MKLSEIRVSIELEGDYTDEQLEAMCEELDTVGLEMVLFDAVHSHLSETDTPVLLKELVAGRAKIGVSE